MTLRGVPGQGPGAGLGFGDLGLWIRDPWAGSWSCVCLEQQYRGSMSISFTSLILKFPVFSFFLFLGFTFMNFDSM